MPNTIGWGTIIALVLLCYVTVVFLSFMCFGERMSNSRIGRFLLNTATIIMLFGFVAFVAMATKSAF